MTRVMKDSGVELIGQIPQDWKLAKLVWCSKFVNGFAFNSENMNVDGEVPVVRIGDIQNNQVQYETCLKVDNNEELKQYELKVGDIVIAMSGATTGKLAVIYDDKLAYINQRVGIIRSQNNRFIRYCLDDESFLRYVSLLSAGSAQPNISMGNILDYKIPYISFDEQQAIADYLDEKCGKIDSVIENQKKIIEKLKEYKQSLITEIVTKGLNPNVKMKDSGIEWIGQIPEHWGVCKIKYNAIFYNGDRGSEYPSGNDIVDAGIPFYNAECIHDIIADTSKCKYITMDKYQKLGGAKLKYGDIMYCLRGAGTGNCAINLDTDNGTIASSLVVIRASMVSNKYLNYFLHSSVANLQIIFSQNGSTVENLSAERLSNHYIYLPPLEEQEMIAEYLDKKCSDIDKAIADKEKLIEKFTEYKKSLIYECVTGKKEIV